MAAQPDREFCAACGWPLGGMRCEACGAEHFELELRDALPVELEREHDAAEPGSEKIAEAFRNKEWTRFVGYSMTAEGGSTVRTAATDEGPGWIAVVRGALVFVTLHLLGQDIAIEAPLVRLPREQRVAVLRAALELAANGSLAHPCLRDDLVIVRARVRLGAATPQVLRSAIVSTAELARRAIETLAVSYRARPAVPQTERAAADFDSLGARRKLAKAIAESAMAPIFEAPARGGAAAPLAVPDDDVPAILDPKPRVRESIPPILAVFGASSGGSVPPPPPRPVPAAPPPPTPAAKRPSIPPLPHKPPAPPPPLPPRAARPVEPAASFAEDRKRTVKDAPVRSNGGRTNTLEIEAVGADLEPGARRSSPSGEIAILPADRLSALLRRAELLAGAPLANSSSVVPWLVRAAVYRAVYEFKDTMPDAVAHLARATGLSGRGAAAVAPEAALAVFERLVIAKGAVPKEKPFVVDPLTSAQQAKEHVSRYIDEIERAANDPGLRHYLATGALCELLVRAKLPAQTGQRLRDIISHAQREGAKPPAIELLMTALKRISA